ncbi:MAG: DUF2294 domain-containing protein [Elainellaceae cyanobacterium]
MDVARKLPTRGQIQRALSQEIQKLYKESLGHAVGKVTCQLFECELMIIVEDSITQPEQLIAEEGDLELAEKVRSDLNTAFRPRLSAVISQHLEVGITDILSDAKLETGRTAIVVVLDQKPNIRASKDQ